MERIPDDLLRRMAASLSDHDRDEMAIPSYLHKNPALRWMAWLRVRAVAERLRRAAAPGEPPTIVDFGCGAGVLLPECNVRGSVVFAVDRQLAPARLLLDHYRLPNVRLLHSDDRATIPLASVDLIVAAEVLEHIEPLGELLDQFRGWLKPGASLLVSLPTENACYRLGRRLAGFHGHYHKQNAETVDAAIREAGFRRTSRRQLPLPGPLAIYWVCEYQR